jgi:hypothetical protein
MDSNVSTKHAKSKIRNFIFTFPDTDGEFQRSSIGVERKPLKVFRAYTTKGVVPEGWLSERQQAFGIVI